MNIPDEILLQAEKPGRYIGNEINMVKKQLEDIDIRFAFCFPDVYEVGMSHLGLQILYYFLNERKDTYCERAFAPWTDMEKIMREKNFPLGTLETFDPISLFDFVGFTLQYEMSYTNLVNMLSLGNIPLLASDRKDNDPIVCAGGPCAYNPEPLADIIDFFYMGEGEVNLNAVLDIYKKNKKDNWNREQYLEDIASIEGIYVPKFYDVTYKDNGEIESFTPNNSHAPKQINKTIVKQLDESFFPTKQLVPLIEIVHDRVSLEVFRGCIRGCRFCQAGYVYRPVREKTHETLIKNARDLIDTSGHDEVSLLSLSTSDYSEFKELAEGLLDQFQDEKVNISLPSLRVDSFSIELMEKIQKGKKGGNLTFAPEAGTQRLRDVINKGITEEEILSGSLLAYQSGIERVKLYFMVGLPTENEDDLFGIVDLSANIVDQYYNVPKELRKRPVSVNMSTGCFVPKPFTPFQWEAQDEYEVFMEKQRLIKKHIKKKQIKYHYQDARVSFMEGVFARGDRRLAAVLIKAFELGARFDGWTEHFSFETWQQAFKETGVDPHFYATRKRDINEILPWDHISIGVDKQFFIDERNKAYDETITPNCRVQCADCGAAAFGEGVCFEK